VFNAAGAGVKTNLLFFTKGGPTESLWYYDLSDVKVGKRIPFTLDKFDDFFSLLVGPPHRESVLRPHDESGPVPARLAEHPLQRVDL
jgi:hypothetical protein